MKQTVQLSIILTTHAKNEHFNALLSNVLSFDHSRLETIIIDDSADVVTTQFIERELGSNESDRVFLYSHSESTGRGASLNEALVHASGSLIWAPLRADRLNESLISEAIRRFNADPAAFWVMDHNLYSKPLEWVNAADEGDLPDDSCFVWNRNVIPASQLFFNPFLDQLHGAELAMRLKDENVWQRTDPFFVIAGDQFIHSGYQDVQELLYTALRLCDDADQRGDILSELANIESRVKTRVADDELLTEARKLLKQGDAARAIEVINRFLKRSPEHQEAIRIKISALEKARRHVEATELKYNLQKKPREAAEAVKKPVTETGTTPAPAPDPDPEPAAQPEVEEKPETTAEAKEEHVKLSVVVPTTAHGKPLLEQTLVNLEKAADADTTELIVIDNASIDDTFDYLEQLKEKDFFNIRVITNRVNNGFAASVNQGIEQARGEYIMIMHNDVELSPGTPELLMKAFGQTENVMLAVPVVAPTNVNAQSRSLDTDAPFVLAERADSCCFMMREDIPVRFDENFGLCYFEMEDFCRQIKQEGGKIAVARKALVNHKSGSTTGLMGLDLNPELKWDNRAMFYKKWNGTAETRAMPKQGTIPERLRKMGAPFNPMKPDAEWVHAIQEFLTSEVKTEILRKDWSEDELLTIVLTLLIADERELLRTLEDRLDSTEPDASLLMMFVNYYFNKNIFSRCKHYMEMSNEPSPVFDLYRLKILVADKEFEEAMDLLNHLLESYPSSPELYYQIAQIYKKNHEEGEANSFYAMANQLDPIRFSAETSAFELNP